MEKLPMEAWKHKKQESNNRRPNRFGNKCQQCIYKITPLPVQTPVPAPSRGAIPLDEGMKFLKNIGAEHVTEFCNCKRQDWYILVVYN